MNKEQIDSILADTGISFKAPVTARSKPVFAGEPISDTQANNLLKKHNVTVDDIRKAIIELSKKAAANIPNDLRYGDRLNEIKVKAPAFSKYIEWNKIDDAIFGYFSLARSSEGGGMLLMITNKDTQYRCIPMSTNTLSNLSEISEACAKMTIKGDHGEMVTLYDHIMYRYDVIMNRALDVYKKRDGKDFGEWAVKSGLPSLMLNNFNLIVNQEEHDVENASGVGKTTMYKAHSLYFGSEKGGKEFPLDCIAKHFESLAGVPSRLAKIPKLYSNDYSEPALYHIDLDDILKEGPHPTWDKYFKRFRDDEAEVIRAFIWSIFKASNTGRQMLYFYDPDGFSGKSVLEKAITSGLGEQLVAALQKDSLNNQFSMAKIWNKRLVVIDDNKNQNLLRSEKMHMILGSGLADVEGKGKNSFLYKIQCKVIASGNTRLKIDPSANHERTRVIIVEPHVTDDMLKEFAVCDKNGNVKRNKYGRVQLIGDATFEANLIEEFPNVLVDCKRDYERLCPKDSSIIISEQMEDALENLSDDTFDIIDDILEDHFEFGNATDALSVRDMCSIIEDEVMWDIRENLSKKSADDLNRDDIVQHMIKRYKIAKKPVRVDGTVKKCYVGLRYLKKKKVHHHNKPENNLTIEQAQQKNEADAFGLFGQEAMKDAV